VKQPAGSLARATPSLATAAWLALVTAIANASAIPELLFPELGALASVVFGAPAGSWARSPLLLVLTPALTAVPGVLITRLMPYGLPALVLDLVLCLLLIRILRSPIVPAISAGILPLTLGITSWLYPPAILVGTGGLALLVALRARLLPPPPGVAAAQAAAPAPAAAAADGALRRWVPAMAVFLLGGYGLVLLLGSRLVLYPPLLVIAYEMLAQRHHCPWQGRYAAVLLVTAGAALAGLLLVRSLGVVPLAVAAAVLITAVLLHLARLRCPPAFGLALLPFVIPSPPPTYPLLTLAGTAWLLLVVAVSGRSFKRRAAAPGL
jgi:hypothetical protein